MNTTNCSLVYPKEMNRSQFHQVYNLILEVVLLGVIILAGMIGNILSILVLRRDRAKGTINLILHALALCDTCFLLCCFFFQFMKTISVWTHWLAYYNFNAYLTYILYGTGMAIRMTRNWTVVLVSIERWIAVCKPLHAPAICTREKARWALAGILLSSFLFCAPQYFVPLVVTRVDNCTGVNIAQVGFRPFLRNTPYFEVVYRVICYTLLIVLVPLTILCIVNCLLVRGVQLANRQRSSLSIPLRTTTSPQDDKVGGKLTDTSQRINAEVNRLCMGVIAVYIVCETPAVLYQVVYFVQHRAAIDLLRPLTNLLVSLNSGINFFIYVFLGKRFRRHLVALFCVRRQQRSSTSDSRMVSRRDTAFSNTSVHGAILRTH